MILKDLRVRGLAAAGALLIAAACGGDEEPGAATPAANDSAAAPAAAAAPGAAQQPAAPAAQPDVAAALDSAMTPAQAAKAAAAAPSAAAGPVTVQAINGYQLTMPRLRALVEAGKNIGALQARRPELRDSMRIPTMDPNLLYQKLNGIADARDAVNRAGVTPEEYAIATAALLQATVVREMRLRGQTPQGQFNEANAKFVTDNWEEIQTTMRAGAPPPAPGQRSN